MYVANGDVHHTLQLSKGATMPAVMDIKFIERMRGDMSLVSQFYDDPAATLGEAGVSEEFSNAVLRRDGKALLAMGWGSEEMEVAFSGRHTSNQFYCSK